MPAALTETVRTWCNAGITTACPALLTKDFTGIGKVPPIMNPRRIPDPLSGVLSRSEGVMTRVRMINSTLCHLCIDCSRLDALAATGTAQLNNAQAMIRAGDLQGTRLALSQFRNTVTLLRDAYRGILIREDLPGETARSVLSVAQSLDVTAVQAGIA